MMRTILGGAAAIALLAACDNDEPEAEVDVAETLNEAAGAPVGADSDMDDTASEAQPVRWVVRDEDSTMTLFPTIHILPEDVQWRSDSFDRTLDEADEVWFEVLPSEMADQAATQELTQRYGFDQETPLSEKLDEETYQNFVAAAEELGLPPQQLEPMRPWLAAITLQVMDLMRDGFTPAAGVETVIAAEVDDSKERALETMEEQLSFFGDLPLEVEIDFMNSVLESLEEGQGELKQFARDWATGDISALEEELMTEFRNVSEELYQVFLVRRNEAWVRKLTEELEGSGTDFVAVGALHLVGEDGVPAILDTMGYDVEGPLPN
jgi:uncharacterized protein YbaP (TraB family)